MIKYIVILLWSFFYVDVFQPFVRRFYCTVKTEILNNGNKCYYWNCKKYLSCKYNGKCLNETEYKAMKFDWLALVSELLLLSFGILSLLCLYNFLF